VRSLPRGSLERRSAYFLVAPAVALLAGVALYPTLAAIWLSMNRVILVFHDRRFVGFENYVFMWTDARFWNALSTTFYFSAVAVTVELALGMGFALLLQGGTRGRGLLRTCLLIPWAIPTVVAAKLWAWLLNPDHGLFVVLMPGERTDWLGSPALAIHAAILVDVWKTTPFVAFLLLAGLVTIPRELYDAAQIDGASRLQTFAKVTLPLLRPTLAVTLIFRTLDAFRVFDAVYALTEGGPANTTETLSVYAYKTLMRAGDFGYGSALSVATFACVMALAAVYIKWLGSSAGLG
jgi:multiple sugar transport system permease protein